MKHFLPSSVMLTPFVVKHYPAQDEETEIDAQQEDELKHVDEEEE